MILRWNNQYKSKRISEARNHTSSMSASTDFTSTLFRTSVFPERYFPLASTNNQNDHRKTFAFHTISPRSVSRWKCGERRDAFSRLQKTFSDSPNSLRLHIPNDRRPSSVQPQNTSGKQQISRLPVFAVRCFHTHTSHRVYAVSIAHHITVHSSRFHKIKYKKFRLETYKTHIILHTHTQGNKLSLLSRFQIVYENFTIFLYISDGCY